MKVQVVFHPSARKELDQVEAYYRRRSPGLGISFLDEIERGLNQIMAFPDSATIVHWPIRSLMIRRFPYGLIYSYEPAGIRVFAIANLKRRPFFWIARI